LQIFRWNGKLPPGRLIYQKGDWVNFAVMSNKIRKVIAATAPGFLVGAVFCTVTLCTQSFLEKSCRIEINQSQTLLLIGLVIAAPFFAFLIRGRDRISWKWSGGILIAFLFWPAFSRQIPAIAATTGRTELTDKKEIRSTLAFLGKSRDLTRVTSTFTHYADGMQVVETKEDTVFADGRISANPRTTRSSTLNTSDYWKIVGILFQMAFSMAMIGGTVAALVASPFATRIGHTAPPAPSRIVNGIVAGLIPFIATLLTTAQAGGKLAGLWYPLGILAVCFVAGALAIPPKGRTFAHVN
jgi:hypothetical protein